MDTGKLNRNDLYELEKNEMDYWASVYQAHEGSPLVPEVRRFGPFQAFKIPGVDILAFNRVLTDSHDPQEIQARLEGVIHFYRVSSIPRFFIQLNDAANRTAYHHILSKKGFIHYNDWTRFYRSTRILPEYAEDGLEVVRVEDEQAEMYAETLVESFDFPSSLKNHFAGLARQPGYRLYLVLLEKDPIAAGALFIRGHYASLAMAGTRPEHRGRGAQGALLRRRLEDARKHGCDLVTVETSRESREKPVASYRNMVRFGFQIVYHRPNFIFYTH
jgi:GNAT superfamily N-acetyltransferase